MDKSPYIYIQVWAHGHFFWFFELFFFDFDGFILKYIYIDCLMSNRKYLEGNQLYKQLFLALSHDVWRMGL